MPYGITKLKQSIRGWIKPVFWALVVIFLIGGAYSFSGPGSRSTRAGGRAPKQRLSKYIAKVNGQQIPRADYEWGWGLRWDQAGWRRSAHGHDISWLRGMKLSAYESLVRTQLLEQAAKREKIRVSGREIGQRRREMAESELEDQIKERVTLQKILDKRGIKLEQYIRELEEGIPEDFVRGLLQEGKLRDKVTGAVSVTDEDLKQSFEEVRISHVLCQPQTMRDKAVKKVEAELARLPKAVGQAASLSHRPTKAKSAEDESDATQKSAREPAHADQEARRAELEAQKASLLQKDWDAEARQRAENLLAQLKGGASFDKLGRKESDDPPAALGEIQLGWMSLWSAGYMYSDLVQAAHGLKEGEYGGPVKALNGWHLIRKDGSRLELPQDFEKNEALYRQQFIERRKEETWSKYERELREQAQIAIVDPELKAYEDQMKLGPDAPQLVPLLNEAVAQDPLNVGAMWELAMVWKQKEQPEQVSKLLSQAVKMMDEYSEPTEKSTRIGRVQLELGLTLKQLGQKDAALGHLKDAAEAVLAVSGLEARPMHEQLREAFKELRRQDLAEAEAEWIKQYEKEQQQAGAGGEGVQIIPQQ